MISTSKKNTRKNSIEWKLVHIVKKHLLLVTLPDINRDATKNLNFVNTANSMYQLLLTLFISNSANPGLNHVASVINQLPWKISIFTKFIVKDHPKNNLKLYQEVTRNTYNNKEKPMTSIHLLIKQILGIKLKSQFINIKEKRGNMYQNNE